MRRMLSMLVLAAMLSGCGQKGPLHLPDVPPPSKKKQTKPVPPAPATNQDTTP